MKNAKSIQYAGSLAVCSGLHLLVDLLCHYYAFFLVADRFPGHRAALFLVYNFVAFALQCPVGLLSDRIRSRARGMSFAFMLVFSGFLLGFSLPDRIFPVVTGLVFCGLGNALLHTVGSGAVMEPGKRGAAGGGVFIAFGALGVGLGDFLGNSHVAMSSWILAGLPVLSCVLWFSDTIFQKSDRPEITCSEDANPGICLLLCLFAVFVRAWGGFLLPGAYKELLTDNGSFGADLLSAMLPSIVGFVGKASGGFIVVGILLMIGADKRNERMLRKADLSYGVFALLLSSVLFAAFGEKPVASVTGTILFNSVMPVTLYAVCSILPVYPGFSLGLTTLMLFAGYVAGTLCAPAGRAGSVLLFALTVSGALALFAVICVSRKERKERKL